MDLLPFQECPCALRHARLFRRPRRAPGDDGGCGCAAGNGPAGACALAPSGQHSPAKTRIPAILEMCPYLKIVLFIRSRDSRYSFPARVQKVPLVGRSNRELAPLPWLEGRHPKGLLQRKVFRERIFAEFARTCAATTH